MKPQPFFTKLAPRPALLMLAALVALPGTSRAEPLSLRAEVTAQREVLTLSDLVEGAPAALADRPLFRAPALGETGTIQARRIADVVAELGAGALETAGRSQIVVTRAARRIGSAEIEAAVKRALELQHGVDARALSVVFEGTPALLVGPEGAGAVVAEDLAYDRRSRRLAATVSVPGSAGERRPQLRVAGTAAELVEVTVLNRPLGRGEVVVGADITIERRPKESVAPDAQTDPAALAGRIARRALASGSVLRVGDLAKPEIIGRGEIVTIVYEGPGLLLTLRGRANEGGAQGDTITIVNPQSKKALHATVLGPGKVGVSAGLPGRVAVHTGAGRP